MHIKIIIFALNFIFPILNTTFTLWKILQIWFIPRSLHIIPPNANNISYWSQFLWISHNQFPASLWAKEKRSPHTHSAVDICMNGLCWLSLSLSFRKVVCLTHMFFMCVYPLANKPLGLGNLKYVVFLFKRLSWEFNTILLERSPCG